MKKVIAKLKSTTEELKAEAKKARTKPPQTRHERTAGRITALEKRFPVLKSVTSHPKLKHWVLPAATTLEVAAGIFAILVLLPWLFSLLPDVNVSAPKIPTPNINLPSINLPNIDLPFKFPKLPAWLETIFYWLGKTLPIWIAVAIAIKTARKNKK